MADRITTFADEREFNAVVRHPNASAAYTVVRPDPGYRLVGAPALVVAPELMGRLMTSQPTFVCSGWVEYRPARIEVPREGPAQYEEDVFGRAAVTVLAPCVADVTKIRLIAHVSGDLTEVFPYLNAEMEAASYNGHAPTFTFMDGYRMVNLYPHRITVAKADEIVDAWRVLEMIRRLANQTWARRHDIEPDYKMRQRPPALEIYKRMPGTNCGRCGERTCLAFAVKVGQSGVAVTQCGPVFGGEHGHLKDALVEICAGLGV